MKGKHEENLLPPCVGVNTKALILVIFSIGAEEKAEEKD
jgi:hypothetical protein